MGRVGQRRAAAAIAWLFLLGAALGPWAPDGTRDDLWPWLLRLMSGDWAGENALVVAEFLLMGLWPVACAIVLFRARRARPVPAWPFLIASFGLGCFALLPWLAIHPGPLRVRPLSRWRAVGLGVAAIAALGLAVWGLAAGDPAAFARTFHTDRFVWTMTWDFAVFVGVGLWLWISTEARPQLGP